VIDEGVQRLGTEKTLIGIHIRRGDYVQNPLGNLGQIPIPVKFILRWLTGNIASVKNPVIYVCSDDPEAYKEIEKAGFEVFTTRQLLPEGSSFLAFEQLDWEILRRCDILITSNSSFSFSSALLSTNSPKCYKFSLREKVFVPFDPWTSEPLEFLFSSPYVWGYLYSRFKLVWQMVSAKAAFVRLFKDVVNQAVHFLVLRVIYLRYTYGFSIKFFTKLINVSHLFQLYSEAPLADNKYHIPFGKETPERKVQEGQNEFSV
jgi:hypothetical protein